MVGGEWEVVGRLPLSFLPLGTLRERLKTCRRPVLDTGLGFLSQAPDQVRGDGGEMAEIELKTSKPDSQLPPT
jgi:hypothetical protein